MINGNISEFIDELTYQDHYVTFNGKKYFFNGCQCKFDNRGKVKEARLEVYNLTDNQTLVSITESDTAKCIETLASLPLFYGKTLYEVEHEMTWTD